jgi:CRP-like cAMP-binding protein
MSQNPTPTNLLSLEATIASAPLFASLSEPSLKQLASHAIVRQHPANQLLLLENDWGGAVYLILEGWVKIRTYNLDGKEITLNIVGKGEVVGEMAVLEEAPRSTDVITLTPTNVCSIPAQDFTRVLHTEPQASICLAQLMAKRLRQINRRLQLREADSQARVVDTLLFIAEGQGKSVNRGTEIPNLPHRELSSMSGLARETVTRVLSKLEDKKLIEREGNILRLLNLAVLQRMIA